eukprot:216489-Pelagomonas_calceolata.AAC.7
MMTCAHRHAFHYNKMHTGGSESLGQRIPYLPENTHGRYDKMHLPKHIITYYEEEGGFKEGRICRFFANVPLC